MADGQTTVGKRRGPRRSAAPTSVDPVEMALEAEAADVSPDSPARRLLVKQERLVERQTALTGWQIASERAGFALKVLTALAGVAVAAVIGVAVWDASRADGVVISSFSTPPEMAARGVTGEALARQLMDRLSYMARTSQSSEDQRGMSGDWGASLSIQIPQTGISIGQADQWLRQKLGHESHVSADLSLRRDGALQLAARSNSDGFPILTGTEDDLPAMIQKTAEAVYAREQPRSFAGFLDRAGRPQEAINFMRQRTTAASAGERAWAFNFIGTVVGRTDGPEASAAYYRRAMAEDPNGPTQTGNLASVELGRGHSEAAYRLRAAAIKLFTDGKATRLSRGAAAQQAALNSVSNNRMNAALIIGDFNEARRVADRMRGRVLLGFAGINPAPLNLGRAAAGLHETSVAERSLADFVAEDRRTRQQLTGATTTVRIAAEDWAGALASADEQIALFASSPDGNDPRARPVPAAQKALALAQLGRIPEAQALIEATPLDCQPCVQNRGAIAALAGQPRLADHWFAEAVRLAPSLPQANTVWGKALLARGDADAALARFTAASKQSPNFPDPILYAGEALLAKGDAKGAIARFSKTQALAGKWGRLHLKWGEALAKQGKAEAAQAQWRAAAGLDLTPAERAELAAVTRNRAS